MPRSRQLRVVLRMLAVVLATVLGSALVAPVSQAATKAPTGLTAVSVSNSAIRIKWTSVAKAPQYMIKVDDNSKFKSPVYKKTTATGFELTKLRPNTTYWIKVRVVNAKGKSLSGYGKTIKIKTRKKGSLSQLSPTGLTARATTSTTATLTWAARGTTNRYRVQYSGSSKFSAPHWEETTGTSVTLKSFRASTRYYARVRVIDAKGKDVSDYSPTISFTTAGISTPPGGITVVDTTTTSATLTWPASAGAPGYRVKYDDDPWDSSRYAFASGNRVTLTGLAPGTRYSVKVRVMRPDGSFLTDYGDKAVVTTDGTSPSPSPSPTPTPSPTPPPVVLPPGSPAPTGLAASAASPTSIKLSWTAIAGAPQYRVKFDVDPWNTPQYAHTTGNSITLTGLTPRTTYSFKVRVMDNDGEFLTDYGATVTATTPAQPTPLVVASYNVRCHNCRSGLAEEKPWTTRRPVIVSAIKAENPDVVGLQEAQQSWLINSDGSKQNKSQFEDLVERLGSPWALTNPARNNCVKSTTPTNCVFKDQGASNGTKIIYRTDRLTLVSKGTVELSRLTSSSYERYLAWAVFEQRATGQRFFFGNIHLEPDNDAPGKRVYHDHRARQARDVLAAIKAKNTGNLPVVLVGDLASSRADEPTNAPYDVLTAGGLIDPLGNVKGSTAPVKPTVETRVNTNYYSFNGWARRARRTTTQVNGVNVDGIFTSPMRVSQWETVVNVDKDGLFVGTIPSDHNMLKATVWIPSTPAA